MPDIHIRLAQPQDQASLVDLFHALWPDTSADDHGRELEAILVGNTPGILPLVIFVAEATDQSLVGFLEVGLRSHADSCDSSHPVGYVEGWYVAAAYRRGGIGKKLLVAVEDWARSQGCEEMASDTQLDNKLSQRVHESLGFQIVERAVLFRKPLR
jgi:aminoglycoside 6'-N-acetyltransferase I